MPSPSACWRSAVHRAGPCGREQPPAAREAVEVFADHRRIEQWLAVVGHQARQLHQWVLDGKIVIGADRGDRGRRKLDTSASPSSWAQTMTLRTNGEAATWRNFMRLSYIADKV
jgi:hypothetical protein